ncbi:MAG: hypothetical protein KAQ88_07785, partial [Hyphomicrobiaceae bacterium]|nr:hypothetical protein [Hyphomicrobiaceae bacterium]
MNAPVESPRLSPVRVSRQKATKSRQEWAYLQPFTASDAAASAHQFAHGGIEAFQVKRKHAPGHQV